MADRRRHTPNEPFDGEFDPSVFDDEFEVSQYADDDFKDYFDEDIVKSGIEGRGKIFSTDEENFGRDGFKQVYSENSGIRSSRSDLENTRIASRKERGADSESLDRTKKINTDELKENIKRKLHIGPSDDEGEVMAKKRKKTGAGSLFDNKLFYALFVACAAVLMAGIVWIMSTDVLGFTKDDVEVSVTIPKDYTISQVANILKDEDVIRFKGLFKIFAAISNADKKISGGTYVLNKNYDYRAIVNGMTKSGGKRVEVEVVIPEGLNMTQIFELLEQKSICFADDLWEAAKNHEFDYDFLDKSTVGQERRLEGYLFPDTYKFYMNDNAVNILDRMLDNFNNRVTAELRQKAKDKGYSLHDIITVASIIEEEAAGDEDRAGIASVIYNRLKNTSGPTAGYLQLDSTINYAIYGTGQSFSTDLDSPYNTYKHRGLPAGPISNPGLAAINAALSPSNTNYYFFAINKERKTQFFSSYDAFMSFVNSSEYGGQG